MKVRVKFSKQGNMKFIGHLDVMRYFQKAIRRAGIDIAYTEGLSPHMIMSFASPLGVGLTSDAEYMDIELRTPIASREAVDALNRVGVEGITVTGFYEIPDGKSNKAMTLVAAADYIVRFRKGYDPDSLLLKPISGESSCAFSQKCEEDISRTPADPHKKKTTAVWTDPVSAAEAFLAQDKIPVWKKTKKSEKEVDIRPMIYEMRGLDDDSFFLKLAAGSAANLKPELVMDTMLGAYGIEPGPFAYEINRRELYADMGTGETRELVPLCALGREICF